MSQNTDNRFGNIGNILSGGAARPRLTDAAPPAPADEKPTEAKLHAVKPDATQPAKTTRASTPRTRTARVAAAGAAGGSCRVPVKVDESLRDLLTGYAARHELTLAGVVQLAVAEAYDRGTLAELVAQPVAEASPAPASRLFSGPATRRKARVSVTVELRMTVADRDVLDQLRIETGAKDRSRLITAALSAYLGADQAQQL